MVSTVSSRSIPQCYLHPTSYNLISEKNQTQPVFTMRVKEKQLSSRGEQSERQTPRGRGSGKTRITHGEDLDGEAHIVLPGYTQDVGQIECEVDDAPTGCGQVSPGEECANEEAL